MRHVFAQMSVAVSSRALLVALDALSVDPDISYVLALWLPVLVSALVAELVSRRNLSFSFNPFQLLPRITREISPLPALVRVRTVVRPRARFGR